MRPLPLAALLLLASPGARAQTRVGSVEAGASNTGSQAGSLTSSWNGGSAPQLVPPGLAAPSLAAAPGFAAPTLAPSPLVAAAPYAAAALAQSPFPAALPASLISPAPAKSAAAPAPLAGARGVLGSAPAELETSSLGGLIDFTKRLFGESSGSGQESAEYFRPGETLRFGAMEASLYRSALDAPRAKSGEAEIAALVGSAEALAKSAGIAVERSLRPGRDGADRPVLRVTPARDGHRLNRLAWDMARTLDSAVEYAPHRTNGGVAAYNAAEKVLFLPDFGRDDAFEAILHESRHAALAKRLRAGDLSAFHAALIAYPGRKIAPDAESYESYMSLEEITTHVKTLVHAIQRARRGGGSEAVWAARRYAYQLADVLRSADINLYQLQRRLAAGEVKTYPVAGESWPAIAGGHWEAINLPHAILVVPVLDGAPVPKRSLFSRLFKAAPESPAVQAARRHVEALRPLARALSAELEPFLLALKGEKPDLEKARASGSRMVALADRADKGFAAATAGSPR